ncbi:serine hydrolase [Janthinobacterium sp. 17J80-10]|uniref:serine hydrolase n=1 Tax=Janthinobacterium sp. 17J80-10 TaxID=2497863 RepID=UPI0010059B9D|nr:serine hydrolase [Janthinobacterium sp. 17J80-10]QAU35459.1 peptidase S11 [Janthinobacterium sp. 17J80-10]
MLKKTLLALFLSSASAAFAMPFHSQHAIVYEEGSGKVLLEKDSHAVVSIASLTKLMTAMVVLDAKLDMQQSIDIADADVDVVKHSSSRVPVGALLPRATVLQLALMSSDNRAAAALARTYPGGREAFLAAVRQKLQVLDMRQTVIEEPTGLSPHNRSTASDLVKMTTAASYYPDIARLSTNTEDEVDLNGNMVHFRNTNRLVGKQDWDIQLSKTGYTREAGRCLIMRMKAAGKQVVLVLLNASDSMARMADAENILRHLEGRELVAMASAKVAKVAKRTTEAKATLRGKRKLHNTKMADQRQPKHRRA